MILDASLVNFRCEFARDALVCSFRSNCLIGFRARRISSKLSNFSVPRIVKDFRKYEEIDPLSSRAQWNKFAMARQEKPRAIRIGEKESSRTRKYRLLDTFTFNYFETPNRSNFFSISFWIPKLQPHFCLITRQKLQYLTDAGNGIAGNNTGEIQEIRDFILRMGCFSPDR